MIIIVIAIVAIFVVSVQANFIGGGIIASVIVLVVAGISSIITVSH